MLTLFRDSQLITLSCMLRPTVCGSAHFDVNELSNANKMKKKRKNRPSSTKKEKYLDFFAHLYFGFIALSMKIKLLAVIIYVISRIISYILHKCDHERV